MAGQPERITVECPRCGGTYEAWALGVPDLDADPQLADPGWIDAQAAATCPSCGHTARCTGLAAEREMWRG
jgi:endogenous inhibitor of DNA gyrase (YacG/DUF329 family)